MHIRKYIVEISFFQVRIINDLKAFAGQISFYQSAGIIRSMTPLSFLTTTLLSLACVLADRILDFKLMMGHLLHVSGQYVSINDCHKNCLKRV